MSESLNRIADDFAKLMTDIAGAGQGVKQETETFFKSHLERLINDMDLVKREEFEVLKDRVEELEEELATLKENK